MSTVGVRYLVDDVREAADFYTEHLGFSVSFDALPAFVALDRDDLRLFLNAPGGPGGASQPMPDGRMPEPGGWNRFQLVVDDIDAEVARLKEEGVAFRNDIVVGRGGSQVLIDDPSGNAIELFQPA